MPGFCLKDALYGIWYVIGNWIISILWGDVFQERDRLSKSLAESKIKFEEEMALYDEENHNLIQDLSNLDHFHKERYTDLHAENLKLREKLTSKAQTKKKDPSKVTKPIKPRAKKKVK